MNVTDLPYPYYVLAEHRMYKKSASLKLNEAFEFHRSFEGLEFWAQVDKGKYPAIPIESIRQLVNVGRLRPDDVLPYIREMFDLIGRNDYVNFQNTLWNPKKEI